MFAKIKIVLPDSRAEKMREHISYFSRKQVTLREYLENQLIHLSANIGPECVVTVESFGLGDGGETS